MMNGMLKWLYMCLHVILIIIMPLITGYAQGVIDLPRTGQTKTYYPGDDGDMRAGIPWPSPRFTDNGNGTITDNLTGLMWLKNPDAIKRTWTDALNYANSLTFGGYTDWRLPNIIEIESLLNLGESDNAEWLNSQGFAKIQHDYWSSTTFSGLSPTDYNGVVLYFDGVGGGMKISQRYVFPVRGTTSGPGKLCKTGQTTRYAPGDDGDLQKGVAWPNPRFEENGDGTITDKLTGLVWLKDANCFGALQWQSALDIIDAFNIDASNFSCQSYTGFYNDWRLPNRKELRSLTDYSKRDPPLPEGNPFVKVQGNGSYWSSTISGNDRPWMVWLGGTVDDSDKSSTLLVWPVRSGIVPITIQSPSNDAHFSACSLYPPPTFSWINAEIFKGYEIQFSADSSFSSPIKVNVSGMQATMTLATWKWKKILLMSAEDAVYWRVVGKRKDKTTFISEVFSIIIDPSQPVGTPTISPTSKGSLPELSWQNNCNIKFKVWFGSDDSFSKKSGYSFSIKNPNDNGGGFTRALGSGQWKAIRKLVGDASGSTIHWYVESWDGLGRYNKTDVMGFALTD